MKRRSANVLLPDRQSKSARDHLIEEGVSHLLPIKVSSVFDTYWRFAAERQDVYFRLAKQVEPWTHDPIISVHTFTNAFETWELLEHTFGAVTFKAYQFEHYDRLLGETMRAGGRIYSAAYIMPPGGSAFGHVAKHQNHLRLLEKMMADDLAGKLSKMRKMQPAFELLRSYPTIGDFLAYQFVTDINYSEVTDFSEMEFVIPGPGARDG
ncbi:MAG: nucleotide kinase domain-containing protein, partial [Burkholderiales bacterium]